MSQRIAWLKHTSIVCLLAGWSLCGLAQSPAPAVTSETVAAPRLEISRDIPLDAADPLAVWFKEQDRLLDDILLRLTRVENLVTEIRRLITSLPDPASVAPAPRAPAVVIAPASAQSTDWLPYLATATIVILLLLWLNRRRQGRTPALPADTPPIVMPAEPVPPAAAAPAAVPRPAPARAAADLPPDEHFNQAIELADIMLSMGLGQGAADTLIEQIRQEPKQALRHWLKLLEIYRRTGQQEEFERSAEELRQHFNVSPGDWLSPPALHASLEDYPHIATRLVELWDKPGCLPYLQNLLSDNRGGARSGFPQAVAEELLLLVALDSMLARR